MKRIAFRVEDTQEYQDWLRQQNETSPQAAQALLPDPNETPAVVNPQGVYEPVTPIRFAATGVGQMAPSSVSPTPANAIARALSSPNVGAVAADPLAKAIDEYNYASAPPAAVTDAIAMLPEWMQAAAEMVAPSRADILTGGGSAVGRGVAKTAKAAAKAADRIVIPVADAAGALAAKTLRVVRPDDLPKVLYHGSPIKGLKELDPKVGVEVPGTTWFSDNLDVAEEYIYPREYGEILFDETPGEVYKASLSMTNPLIVDFKGEVGDAITLSRLAKQAKQEGYDGLIVRNVDDTIGSTKTLGTSYAVFDKSQIKLKNKARSSGGK